MRFKHWLLSESKQEISNLGFPKIVIDLFWQKFGKNAFLISKWFKEYNIKAKRIESPDW